MGSVEHVLALGDYDAVENIRERCMMRMNESDSLLLFISDRRPCTINKRFVVKLLSRDFEKKICTEKNRFLHAVANKFAVSNFHFL